MKARALLSYDQILPILPHRPPFLFVDVVWDFEPGKTIHAERRLRAEEPQFTGHFPGQPIMPGVLLGEALAQASGLLLALTNQSLGKPAPLRPKRYYLAETRLKFTHPAIPGDTLLLSVRIAGEFGRLFKFTGEAKVSQKLIAAGSWTLADMEA